MIENSSDRLRELYLYTIAESWSSVRYRTDHWDTSPCLPVHMRSSPSMIRGVTIRCQSCS
jgi:hypothetical protein